MPKQDAPKDDRHSHNPKSHVDPNQAEKKGGAGAHNWGKEGDKDDAPAVLDKGDPNYDSDEEKKKAAK
uniref:Hyaluronan/mRNA-binding protein domain-containing protein n=1 Tax=Chromera velia CCMP2878 TaxID=1169474 RepID=A0A0G4I1K6_9ALVE|eukprot:Cvel_10184.t1-p1 / transcript=Cvel_10184.t1 / gene=Cvel_10184 / organism=Chromera_velia_CCMP2878 / gene_product=hypothetical protein / transcript_product=hypothetical protein / location=Cvel_scaffold608:64378-64755(-) / protein_length=67 / sequence_SO=supercontig / SO=protein_coding / is_pseudo=false